MKTSHTHIHTHTHTQVYIMAVLHLHLNIVLIRRTSGRRLRTLNFTLLRTQGNNEQKSTLHVLNHFTWHSKKFFGFFLPLEQVLDLYPNSTYPSMLVMYHPPPRLPTTTQHYLQNIRPCAALQTSSSLRNRATPIQNLTHQLWFLPLLHTSTIHFASTHPLQITTLYVASLPQGRSGITREHSERWS